MSKKNTYYDIDELLNDIRSDIEETLKDEVFDEVREIELEHIERDILSAYTPKIYERRTSGGIDDPRNIVGYVKDMQLSVDNITEFNSGYGTKHRGTGLAQLINDGDSFNGYFYDYPGEFNQPRPFIDNTILEVEKTDRVENALEKGMRKRKYDIS